MSEPSARPGGTRTGSGRIQGLVAFAVLAGGLAVACGVRTSDPPTKPEPQVKDKEGTLDGIPLFATWPKGKKPDAAIVLTGQTFGHLQPCGCSRPQYGGLERRANFITGLKAKGWTVAGFDLGDVFPARHAYGPSGLRSSLDQSREKYKFSMNALKEMGYLAVGLGKTEYEADILLNVLGEYALQKEQPPFTLAGNLLGLADGKKLPREQHFGPPQGAKKPLVGFYEVFTVGGVPVGVAGVTGPSLAQEAVKLDKTIDFDANPKILGDAVVAFNAHPQKPVARFLLYQGTVDEAKLVAEDWPQFDVILCQASDPEPPQFPMNHAGKKHPPGKQTMIVQVGHKGRYVGVVGVFNTPAGVELKYQLIRLGEEYLTPNNPQAEKENKVLGLLEEYAGQVKARKFLKLVTPVPHPAQVQHPNLNISYMGSDRCKTCHQADFAVWAKSGHSHALDTLEKKAKRPGLRDLDAECAVCHTVGLGFKTGFEDAQKTPDLKHVGCESCHGPGSGHSTNPMVANLGALMSPWKQAKGDRLPDVATMEKMAKLSPVERTQQALPGNQQRVFDMVERTCRKCHDEDNDPHFDLFKYWPKIAHGPPPAGGGAGGGGAKK